MGLELHHHVFDLRGRHLAVRHADAGLGRGGCHAVHGVADRVHAVGDVVDLALARELGADRGRDHVGVVLPHRDLHGQAARRRREDQAHVAHARHRHLHRARDGRGREREHVDLLAHVFELLLVLHAEALFLVDHHQAQVVGVDVGREEPVRADQDVDVALGEALERLALLRGRHEAREYAHVQVKGGKARKEGLEMLLRQDRGGAQDHDLLAVLAALEGGPERHFRLAEADVAAEKTIHRARGLHVGLDVGDRGRLVGRHVVGEAGLHVGLRRRIGAEGVARHRGAAGVEIHEVEGKLFG